MTDQPPPAMHPIPESLQAHLSGATQWSSQRLCEYLAVTLCGVPVVASDLLIQRLVREMGDVIVGVAARRASGERPDPSQVEERAIELAESMTIHELWLALGTLGLARERVACRLDELEVQLRAILRDELVRVASRARMPTTELDLGTALPQATAPARLRLIRH
jgi:hypothetical protein